MRQDSSLELILAAIEQKVKQMVKEFVEAPAREERKIYLGEIRRPIY